MTTFDYSQAAPEPGAPGPLGAHPRGDGVQFALVCRHAVHVWLALFNGPDDAEPAVEFQLDAETYRFGDLWSCIVSHTGPGTLYAWRVSSEAAEAPEPAERAYLLDPYALAYTGAVHAGQGKSVVVPRNGPSVRSGRAPVPLCDSVIYETHIRGFTRHPSSGVASPGTYRGFIEKIPHLKALGVTTVEFLPLHECGDRILPRKHPLTGEPLFNYWGYSPIYYFAPTASFTVSGDPAAAIGEFCTLTSALHDAGLEVLVDVVYNHTAEGAKGHLSFRGLDDGIYYLKTQDGKPIDVTGCGNTLWCDHPIVQDLIVESLRYWVTDLGVDGFRFDLATVLNRDSDNQLHGFSALVRRITEDPVLRNVKLIAEAGNLCGGYQVGHFGTPRWAEWNERFSNDVRRFWRGDEGTKGDFARRITGSADLYQATGRGPTNSINYICAHDGFTLRDLVSYQRKHNLPNGEHNRDGTDYNLSWNCGVEGETDDELVNAIRRRMQKNFLATLFLSAGVPMLLGGDEFGRTQRGNNNAYCQDNDISWYDWGLLEEYEGLHRFCREMVRFRQSHPVFRRTTFFDGRPTNGGSQPDLAWFDPAGRTQDWDSRNLALACRIDASENDGVSLFLMFNPSMAGVSFALPEGPWYLRIDTGKAPPRDIVPMDETAPRLEAREHVVGPKSLVLLSSK